MRFAEARGVVLEGQAILQFIHAEAAEAVGVGEFTEALELLGAERGVQGVGDFKKCHAGIIAAASGEWEHIENGKLKLESGKRGTAGGSDG